jgi:SAM-dependent methyltransferase
VNTHPIRGRLNAWLLGQTEGLMHESYGKLKSQLLSGAQGTVVELGPGAGANMRYLPRGTRLIAIEPNPYMHAPLRRRAAILGIELDLRGLAGESLDLPDASADLVFCTLVLCSVDDPARVLGEVRRILKPGGEFVCLEHIAAPPDTWAAGLQRALRRPWRWLFEGCDLCRNTGASLKAAGFGNVELREFDQRGHPAMVRRHLVARCSHQPRP